MTVTRPDRTAAHATRDALLAQFRDVGLVPVISTNGGIPDADIQVVKGTKPGEVVDCWLTERGKSRLSMGQRTMAGMSMYPPLSARVESA